MRSRHFLRRSSTAAGIYSSALLGFLATVAAARLLSLHDFGLFAVVMAATSFLQTLLDLTVEEALTKYGFRYQAAEDWGRLRRLVRRALRLKLAGGVLAGIALLAFAPAADAVFGTEGLTVPFVLAALIPPLQAAEPLAGTALILRGRYDIRGGFLALSMGLRFAAVVVGARWGLAEAIGAIAAAQALATAAVGAAGLAAFRRFPAGHATSLGEDAAGIKRFVLQSSLATGVVSLRTTLAPLLLGIVSNPAQVGFFRAALTPQQALHILSAPARMIMLTEQTRDWEHGARDRVLAGVRRYSAGAAAITAVASVPLLVFMPDLIGLVFPREFVAAADAARLVLLAAVVQFVFGWTKSLPVTIGRPTLRIATHGVETLVLVPLVLVLGAAWGATGAAVAILVSSVVFAVHWTVLFLRLRREPWDLRPPQEAVAR